MAVSLDELIVEHRESLVDGIVKDAIRQIPSYGKAPLRVTIERVERFLQALADSVAQNEPDILERYLVGVAEARKQEGYAILELHSIVHITEAHLQHLIEETVVDEVQRNGLSALLEAVVGAARMVLSVQYALSAQRSGG
jgi:hypothetical protein